MSSNTSNTAPKYFDLHVTGIGYLDDARVVEPKTGGRKFKPFLSVRISALHGDANDVQHTRFKANVVNAEAERVLRQYMPQINDRGRQAADGTTLRTQVLAGFRLGDLTPTLFTHSANFANEKLAGKPGVSLDCRFIKLMWLKVDGETVYTAPEDDTEIDQDDSSDADDGVVSGTVADNVEPENRVEAETPFGGDPGDTVTLEKGDPEFDAKKTWLKSNGYRWNSNDKSWNRQQAA